MPLMFLPDARGTLNYDHPEMKAKGPIYNYTTGVSYIMW